MSEQDVRLALSIFADATQGGMLDMAEAIADDELWDRNQQHFDPEAKIKFVIPGDGVEVMEQEYVGIEGLRAGWRAWLVPWDSYLIVIDEIIDAGEGGVLLLVTSAARMRDTGAEVPQSAATRFVVKDDRIAEVNFYLDQQQARREAGLA